MLSISSQCFGTDIYSIRYIYYCNLQFLNNYWFSFHNQLTSTMTDRTTSGSCCSCVTMDARLYTHSCLRTQFRKLFISHFRRMQDSNCIFCKHNNGFTLDNYTLQPHSDSIRIKNSGL